MTNNCNRCPELERENALLKAKLQKAEKRERNYRTALEGLQLTAACVLEDNDSEFDEMLIALKAVNKQQQQQQQAGTSSHSAPPPKKARSESWVNGRRVLLSAFINNKVCVLRECYINAGAAEERDRYSADIIAHMKEMGLTGNEERYSHITDDALLEMVEEKIAELLGAD